MSDSARTGRLFRRVWSRWKEVFPWLFTLDKKKAACPEDHRLVLLLLDLLHLPAGYFEPFQESPGVIVPENIYAHGFGPCTAYFINYTCRDDGGLLSDPSPVGKTFTLTDHYGLKAALTIRKVRSARYWKEPDYDGEYFLSHPESFPSGIDYLPGVHRRIYRGSRNKRYGNTD